MAHLRKRALLDLADALGAQPQAFSDFRPLLDDVLELETLDPERTSDRGDQRDQPQDQPLAGVGIASLRSQREFRGYRPNIVSRSLRTGTTHTIGFISDTVATTPFAGHLIWGALDAARERGHLLFTGETEGDPELERQLIEAMHDRPPRPQASAEP